MTDSERPDDPLKFTPAPGEVDLAKLCYGVHIATATTSTGERMVLIELFKRFEDTESCAHVGVTPDTATVLAMQILNAVKRITGATQ